MYTAPLIDLFRTIDILLQIPHNTCGGNPALGFKLQVIRA